MAQPDWVDISKLVKAYQNDLTKKAAGIDSFYSQYQGPLNPNFKPLSSNSSNSIQALGNLGTPIKWNDNTDQANESVANRGGPSVVGRIFDVLSRPSYAVSEALRQKMINEQDPNDDRSGTDNVLGAFWEGFSGRKKTNMTDVMDQHAYNKDLMRIRGMVKSGMGEEDARKLVSDESRFTDMLKDPSLPVDAYKMADKGEGSLGRAALGLGLTVATDPLTYLGGPIARGVVGGVSKGYKAARGIKDLDMGYDATGLVSPKRYVTPLARPNNNIMGQSANLKPVPDQYFVSDKVNPLIAAFSTGYKNRHLRPEVMAVQQSARARAVSRASALNAIAKNYKPDEIKRAFEISQSRATQTGDARIDDLAINFETAVRDLINASDLRQYSQVARNDIRGSTQGLIDDINEQLRIHGVKNFQFATKVRDAFKNNKKVDLSQSNRWLDGWKYHKFEDPLLFMSKLSHAVENVTAKYKMLDEFAERFGSRTHTAGRTKLNNGKYTPEHTAGIRNQRLQGLYFDPILAREMNHVLKNWDLVSNPRSPFIKHLDNATTLWKTGVTIYAPSHHIRNMIGDLYFSWMDGVNTIKPYRIAKDILRAERSRYGDVFTVTDLTKKNALEDALYSGGRTALTTKGGIPFSHQAIYTAAYEKGLLQSSNIIEDVGEGSFRLKDIKNPVLHRALNPTGGRVAEKVRNFTEVREHYAKLAHFVDALKKTKTDDYEMAVEQAAQRVRKWHPDGMDLTGFERNYMRRLMPFYSWTRKSIPLVVESAVMNPSKTLMYPRLMQMIQDAQGVQTTSIEDPFPEDQLFPDWIKEKGIGPTTFHGMDGLSGILNGLARSGVDQTGAPKGYNVINPSNPLIDTVANYAGMGRFSDSARGLASSVNPLFRVPAEVSLQTTSLGTPIGYDPAKYATEQVPILAYLSQLGNLTPFGPTQKGEKEGLLNMESIFNYLTAAGLKGTGANIKQAEFEAKERAKRGEK